MRAGPGNGDLACAGAELARDGEHGVEYLRALRRVLRLEYPATEAFGAAFLAFPVFAGQHAAAQRRPGHDAEAQRVRRREQVGLGLAMNQAVLELRGRNGYCASKFRQGDRTGKPPSGEIRQTRIEDLARARKTLEATDDFLGWRGAIGMM